MLGVQRRPDDLEAELTGDSTHLLDFRLGWSLGRDRPRFGGTADLREELLEAGFERQDQAAGLFLNQITVRDAVRSDTLDPGVAVIRPLPTSNVTRPLRM